MLSSRETDTEEEEEGEEEVLYRGTIRLKRKSAVETIVLDNDPISLARDHRRLSGALTRVTDGDVSIVDTKRDDGEVDDSVVSDLFILSECSLEHEAALQRYLTQNEDEVRYSLCRVEHMMPARPNRSTRPVVTTLAIRRRALRPISRLVWFMLPVKLILLGVCLYSLFLLYRLLRL